MQRCGFNPWVRKIPRRRKGKPIPAFLPEKYYGQRRLAGCSPWGYKELDMTERLPLLDAIPHVLCNIYIIVIVIFSIMVWVTMLVIIYTIFNVFLRKKF